MAWGTKLGCNWVVVGLCCVFLLGPALLPPRQRQKRSIQEPANQGPRVLFPRLEPPQYGSMFDFLLVRMQGQQKALPRKALPHKVGVYLCW